MKKRERKIISAMIKAVKRGHAFTLHGKDGEPQALVLPWSDWQALNQKLVALERKYVAPGARHLSDPNERIPEDLWGQGDAATTGHVSETECDDNDCQLHETYRRYAQHLEGEKATVLPPKVFTNAPNAIMATEADEAELQKRYGMTSEQLADEAERGYDPVRMESKLKESRAWHENLVSRLASKADTHKTQDTDDDEGDFLNPSKIQ